MNLSDISFVITTVEEVGAVVSAAGETKGEAIGSEAEASSGEAVGDVIGVSAAAGEGEGTSGVSEGAAYAAVLNSDVMIKAVIIFFILILHAA